MVNQEYIYKTFTRLIHMFNKAWLSRYLRSYEVMFDYVSDFKRYFVPFLQYFYINHLFVTFENSR